MSNRKSSSHSGTHRSGHSRAAGGSRSGAAACSTPQASVTTLPVASPSSSPPTIPQLSLDSGIGELLQYQTSVAQGDLRMELTIQPHPTISRYGPLLIQLYIPSLNLYLEPNARLPLSESHSISKLVADILLALESVGPIEMLSASLSCVPSGGMVIGTWTKKFKS